MLKALLAATLLYRLIPAKPYLFEKGHHLTFLCNSSVKLKQFVRRDSLHRKQIIRVHVLPRVMTNLIFEHFPSPVSSPVDSGVLRCYFASLGKTHVICSAI